jgi:hypothetical protein
MRALSVKQPWASEIASGEKTEEYRTWAIKPGPLVIAASKSPRVGRLPTGVALCVVDVVACDGEPGDYTWELANVRPIAVPFAVRGSAAIYHVDDAKVGAAAKAPPAKAKANAKANAKAKAKAKARERLPSSAPARLYADGSPVLGD